MDAARAAADQAIWFVADHPDAPFTEWDQTARWQIHRRQARQAAPGWKPMQMDARQPSAQYKDFREEKERDVVIASQMPLMILRKDSSKHNLSSARFDGVRYTRSITRQQAWFNRRALNFFLERLITLARLDGSLRMDAPRGLMKLRWSWPKPPSNDPVKDRQAERLGLENGTLTYSEALGNNGLRVDQTIEQRVKDNTLLLEAGLQPIIGPIPAKLQDAPVPWIEDETDDLEDDSEATSDDPADDSTEDSTEDDTVDEDAMADAAEDEQATSDTEDA
jgi:capsid protein